MLSPVPTFIPSVSPWTPGLVATTSPAVWGMTMGVPLSVSPTYASNAGYSPNWNFGGATSNFPCNYWVGLTFLRPSLCLLFSFV